MAVGKEIKEQISSVQSTQKITSAMEKVAVSKMRRAQQRMEQSRPYADKIRDVIGHLANATSEYRHRYLQDRDVKRVGYIVVSSDPWPVWWPEQQHVQAPRPASRRVERKGC